MRCIVLISDCGLGAVLGGGWCREELDQEQRTRTMTAMLANIQAAANLSSNQIG
jgi:hypothetical protein